MKVLSLLPIFFFCPSVALAAESAPDFTNEKLLGDWGGARTRLYEKGVDVALDYSANLWSNLDGGAKTGSRANGDVDLVMSLDGERLFGSHGTTASFYVLGNHGGRINDLVGSLQGVDNMEVPTTAWKLYEAWIDQLFWNDNASIRVGLYDLNSEFDVTDASGLFLGPTYGIDNAFAATGQNGPSIFPTTSLGARLLVNPSDTTYIQAAILDGVPGDPAEPRGTHVNLHDDDGSLLAVEAGFQSEGEGKLGIGAWRYTEDLPAPVSAITDTSQGIYVLAERPLAHSAEEGGYALTGFARAALSDGEVSLFQYSWSTGIHVASLIPGRPDGQFGVGISGATLSEALQPSGSPDQEDAEYALEVTYGDMLMPWLWVQPDFQYIINPGIDPALGDAVVAGVRVALSF